MPGTLMSSRHAELDFTSMRIALSKAVICSRSCRQAISMGRTIRAVEHQSFDLPIEWQSLNRAWQKAEGLEYASDVVGQSGPHTDELRPCTENGACAMAVERLDVNGPVPASSNDLS
jgi:hypothetical protein